MNKKKGQPKGLTLTEVLAVLTLISLLVTLAIPPISGYIHKQQLIGTLRRAGQLLRQGMVLAKKTYTPHRLTLEEKTLALQQWQEDQWGKTVVRHSPPPGIGLKLNTPPVFYPNGAIVPLGTLSVSQGRSLYQITLSAAGRIRVKRIQ